MPDEPAPATPDTPTIPNPDTHDVPWQKRYEDLRPEFDRTKQELASERAAWEDEQALIARIADKFPHLLAEEEDTPELEPDDDEPAAPPPDPRIDWLAQREAERQYQTDLKKFVGDRELPEEGNEWIEARSRLIADKAGKPWGPDHLKQAVNEFYEFVDKVKGPQRREAPTPPQPGSAGEKKRDPRSRDERRAKMAAALAAGEHQ